MKAWPPKDPDARKQYWFDFSDVVAEEGSPLASYVLELDNSPDAELLIEGDVRSGSVVSLWLDGGTRGAGDYTVRCRYELESGFRDDESRTIAIIDN